jgi:hypothetical protein
MTRKKRIGKDKNNRSIKVLVENRGWKSTAIPKSIGFHEEEPILVCYSSPHPFRYIFGDGFPRKGQNPSCDDKQRNKKFFTKPR